MKRAQIRSTDWTHTRPEIVTVQIELPAGDWANKATDGNYLRVKAAPWWHRAKLAIRRRRES